MATRFDRRSLLAGGAALTAGLAVLGDATQSGAVLTHGRGLNGISKGKPRRGGTVVIGCNAEEQGFNPTTGRFDNTGFLYARAVFDPLMITSATGQPLPYLAESVTPNAEYTVWTVTLRPGLKFHDGTPCDGAALLQNIDAYVKSPLTGIALAPIIASYAQTGPLSVAI